MPSIEDLVLVFSLAECRFAIEVKELVEVTEGLMVTSSTSAFEGALGTIDFRDDHVPLLNIGQSLKVANVNKRSGVILVVRINGRTVAFPVDAVICVSGTKKGLLPFPERMMEKKGLYSAVFDKDGDFILLINLENLFDSNFFDCMDAAGSDED